MAFRDAAYHITRDTADLYVEAVGPEDGQPVYYLHGGPGYNSFSFRDLLGDSLEEQLLLYADQRGGGRSYAEAPFSFELLADDVRSVLKALDISSASLLGHGFGAAIAVEVAATWPELVDRLRSEERRVGKECRARWGRGQWKKNRREGCAALLRLREDGTQ